MSKKQPRVEESTNPPGEKKESLRLEWRSPQELAENPRNWRTHPQEQLSALTDAIAEVGWAGACLYNERTGRLIDGHARRKVALEQGSEKVPVLVGDWSEEQEKKILATLDPLSALATADAEKLQSLLSEVETSSASLLGMLQSLAQDVGIVTAEEPQPPPAETPTVQERYAVLVDCTSEQSQAELLERLTSEGYTCRALIV